MSLIPIFSPCAASILNLFDSEARDVFVASAFLRMDAVSEMLARLLKDRTAPCRLRVLTRGSFSDILAGASDIASLALLTKAHHPDLSIECRRDPRLHAKIYVVDGCRAITTSANLTSPGLLTNIEFGLFVDSPEIVKNILDYFEPIWEMAERFDENILHDLSSGAEEERSERPSEFDLDVPAPIIHRRKAPKLRRPLARLPKTEAVKLNASWDELNKLGMDLELARATIATGTLNKALRRTVRVYDKAKQFDIGPETTISPEEVLLINNIETLKLFLTSPNWELRDAAAEALGNIFGDKATQVLLEALQREHHQDVLWSILISLKPRISEQNLDQVLELPERETNVNVLYLVYLIAATVDPQLYGAKLIQHTPNIYDSEYIQEVESILRRLSDSELVELAEILKDSVNTLRNVMLLLFFARGRGDEVENQVISVLFPNLQEMLLRSPNWEHRDAAAEVLGNIFGDKATQVLLEALRREYHGNVLCSILISLKPRISEQNLDQVLKLSERKTNINVLYLVYLIAATVKPQLYGAELIRHIPDIYDREYIEEVETALRGSSDGEFIEIINSLKGWINSFKKLLLLLSFAQDRGDEIVNQIRSILFPHLQESATPMMDWVANSLLQTSLRSDKFFDRIPDSPRKRLRTELKKRIWTNLKTPSGE